MDKPPLGLRTKEHSLEDRAKEVFTAMTLYRLSGNEIPQQWIIEYIDIKLELEE